MLKHVQISPLRNRADSVSLRSTSASCASSICGSPEPPTDLQRTPSRASSYSSLSEQLPQTTIKVYTNCLKIDIEYKTLGIQWDTTSKEVIAQLLRRLKMRHRDPRLFYLSMEVFVRSAGVKTVLVLDDDTRPAVLQACQPKGESRFCLQLKPGGLIRVHTSALQPSLQYKSLVISEETTSDELLQLLLSSYNSVEPVEQFSIYEVCPGQEYQRKLHPDDIPLRAQNERMKRGETCHFLVRRNPNYVRRRQLLGTLNGVISSPTPSDKLFNADCSLNSLDQDANSLLDLSIESLSDDLNSILNSSEDDDSASSTSGSSRTSESSGSSDTSEGSTTVRRTPAAILSEVPSKVLSPIRPKNCLKCCQSFNAADTTNHNLMSPVSSPSNKNSVALSTYNPVYNIREIRTVSHSFSSLGKDKKLLDIQTNGRFDPTSYRIRPQSVFVGKASRMVLDTSSTKAKADLNGNNTTASTNTNNNNSNGNSSSSSSGYTSLSGEAVNNNPAKGLGHFVYL